MAFDKNLDVCKSEEVLEFEKTSIKVGIYSYNDGVSKIQLSRERTDEEGNIKFAKLGRLTKDEAEKVNEAMGKLIPQM